jgi:hypothetical protein
MAMQNTASLCIEVDHLASVRSRDRPSHMGVRPSPDASGKQGQVLFYSSASMTGGFAAPVFVQILLHGHSDDLRRADAFIVGARINGVALLLRPSDAKRVLLRLLFGVRRALCHARQATAPCAVNESITVVQRTDLSNTEQRSSALCYKALQVIGVGTMKEDGK